MGKVVTKFDDGSFLEYDKGKFDDWCVYLTRPSANKYAPRDSQYFERLSRYAKQYGVETLYDDFVQIYDRTGRKLDNTVFDFIKELCTKYSPNEVDIAIDFSIIYMGMVAEEKKAFTKLGKRIKRLGVYQVLIEEMDYHTAANFSRGKKWEELAQLCSSKGF